MIVLLDYLYSHIDQPEHQVRFRWRDNSVAIWDNRVTQHYALADYLPDYRCMNRVTVNSDSRAARLKIWLFYRRLGVIPAAYQSLEPESEANRNTAGARNQAWLTFSRLCRYHPTNF